MQRTEHPAAGERRRSKDPLRPIFRSADRSPLPTAVLECSVEAEPGGGDDTRKAVTAVNERLIVAGLREQEQADRARRDAAESKALLENMSEGVIVLDADGAISLVNPVGRALLGLRPT